MGNFIVDKKTNRITHVGSLDGNSLLLVTADDGLEFVIQRCMAAYPLRGTEPQECHILVEEFLPDELRTWYNAEKKRLHGKAKVNGSATAFALHCHQ